ncbi:DUF3093 domain-containing protein [Gordonia hankookensis]|uniref:DUF3093 domain-containing protein n=1 Tax=Gordonia hankookensis TaxID=589403 RepID=A0ABR7W961_9ACTN|nr:DUF3093 domain-containing protein [Gordonia hankookensis]
MPDVAETAADAADATAEAADDTADTDDTDTAAADDTATDDDTAEAVDEGEVLFYEPGGSWWVVSIGPILIGAVLATEIAGPGQVHWPVMMIFAVILVGFSLVQVHAARTHVSVRLTEVTLQQGTRKLPLTDIAKIYPENNGPEHQTWESARALGELPAVPRRRKGVGVKLADGGLAQAWARDVGRFRDELTVAHQAAQMGLPPRGRRDDS